MDTVVIKSFDTTFSASILLGRLEHAGITGYLRDEYTVLVNPLLANAIGGVKLAVDVNDAEEAMRILDEFEDEELKEAICPVCKHQEFAVLFRPLDANIIVSLLSKLFSKSVPQQMEKIFRCAHCKYETDAMPFNTTDELS